MTSEASPISQMRDKILEGLGALKAAHEALLDVAEITATLIEDLETSLEDFEHYELLNRAVGPEGPPGARQPLGDSRRKVET